VAFKKITVKCGENYFFDNELHEYEKFYKIFLFFSSISLIFRVG
jgi:hypothetical protein